MAKKKKDKTLLYIIIGIIALVLILSVGKKAGDGGGSSSSSSSSGGGGSSSSSSGGGLATCADSDGDNRDVPGSVTYGSYVYTDRCLDVGQGVTEYVCQNGAVSSRNYLCDVGEICSQTRSGGHCIPAPHVWHPGDTVMGGSGSGTITGGSAPLSGDIDLADYGITTDGNCQLGARIQTSWSYASPQCTGIQGMEGILWQFFDSSGLEYQRLDSAPLSLGIDLHPTTHYLEWDGVTNWHGQMSKTLNIPGCIIDYEYSIEIYIYSCS